jgi:hypothetical protein
LSQLRSASSLELEIQALLIHYGQPDLAADALLKKYENEKLSAAEFEALATFFLKAGFAATLTDFILRKLDQPQSIPWGHFVEALFQSSAAIEPEIKQALIEGAESQRQLSHLARSRHLDHYEEEVPRQRLLRRQNFKEQYEKLSEDYFHQLEVLRSQQLYQDEEKLLQKMRQFFPQDSRLDKAVRELRERRALDFMSKQAPKDQRELPVFYHEPRDPEIQQMLDEVERGMNEILAEENENTFSLAVDFAVAQLMWENEESAIRLLDQVLARLQKSTSSNVVSTDWLRAEILLRGRKFVSLLDHLTWLESTYGNDPETVFSVQYLRAQALWGLNQKFTAIESIEGLLQARPDYRTAHALLDAWKEDLA